MEHLRSSPYKAVALDQPVYSPAPASSSGGRVMVERKMQGVQTEEDRSYSLRQKVFLELDAKEGSVYQRILQEKLTVEELRDTLSRELLEANQSLAEREAAAMKRIQEFKDTTEASLEKERTEMQSMYKELITDVEKQRKKAMDMQEEATHYMDTLTYMYCQRMKDLTDMATALAAQRQTLEEERRKVARQRLNLDIALQQMNHFNCFSLGMTAAPHQPTSPVPPHTAGGGTPAASSYAYAGSPLNTSNPFKKSGKTRSPSSAKPSTPSSSKRIR